MALLTQAIRGTGDVLPNDSHRWQFVENTMLETARLFGFREIRTPVFEHTELFVRSVGDTTDVVQKEMYTFDDNGGRSITLRPEGTAGAVRAFLEHGLHSWVIASGVFGLLVGFAAKLLKMDAAEMGKKGLIKFNVAQLVSHVICWGGVAPVLDILIYNEPLDKLFAQGLFSGISNAVTTAIVGSLLCVTYAATKTKAGSLTKE